MTLKWTQVGDVRKSDGDRPTRTYQATIPEGTLYRTATVWPGCVTSEALVFVPAKTAIGEDGLVEDDCACVIAHTCGRSRDGDDGHFL